MDAASRSQHIVAMKNAYCRTFSESKLATGENLLERDLKQALGTKNLTCGTVAACELTLLQKGCLTPAERLFHLINGSGNSSRCCPRKVEILAFLSKLNLAEKIILMEEYAQLRSEVYDYRAGKNPLLSDLEVKLKARDYHFAEVLLELFVFDQRELPARICAEIDERAYAEFSSKIRERYGSVQKMAEKYALEPKAFSKKLSHLLEQHRDNVFSNWLNDFFGPEGKVVEESVRQIRFKVSMVQGCLKKGEAIPPRLAESLRRSFSALELSVRDYKNLKEHNAHLASQIATVVLVVAASAALGPEVAAASFGTSMAEAFAVPMVVGATAKAGTRAAFLGHGYDAHCDLPADICKGLRAGAIGATIYALSICIPEVIDELADASCSPECVPCSPTPPPPTPTPPPPTPTPPPPTPTPPPPTPTPTPPPPTPTPPPPTPEPCPDPRPITPGTYGADTYSPNYEVTLSDGTVERFAQTGSGEDYYSYMRRTYTDGNVEIFNEYGYGDTKVTIWELQDSSGNILDSTYYDASCECPDGID